MKSALNLIPKVIAVVIVATASWLVYTNMLPTAAPEESAATEDAEQETEEPSAEIPWKSGYSLTAKNNTMVIPIKKMEKATQKETDSSATDNSNANITE
jgi:hypothetical protein